jgi:patatin-like phospholipase/acyl hydrolase
MFWNEQMCFTISFEFAKFFLPHWSSFAVQKFLAVVSNTNKGNDVRKEITISLVKQIIEALPTICSSYIEAILNCFNF